MRFSARPFVFTVALASLLCHCTVSPIVPTFENLPDGAGGGTFDGSSQDGGAALADGALAQEASTSADSSDNHPKLVFVTTEGFLANLVYEGKDPNPLTAADNLCNRVALRLAPRPHGTFHAWLSTSKVDAIDHLVGNGPWFTYSGELAFTDKASIPSGPKSLVWEGEGGNGIDLGNVGTGTFETGKKAPNLNCSDWTDSSSLSFYRYGVTNPGTSWTSQGTRDCSSSIHLYCFED